jgi:hypothetical protein
VAPVGSQNFMEATCCDQLRCEVCEFAKSKRKPICDKTTTVNMELLELISSPAPKSLPRKSHAGAADKGMMFNPTDSLRVDHYIDADIAGLWGIEHNQDPVSVKWRTVYLIVLMFMGSPILLVSKLQT